MAKEKGQSHRSYDDDGYKKRAACVCVKNENENEVLLISSNKNKQHWIIPGGGVEKNEKPEQAAAREVFEEAGVVGRLGRLLGIFEERKHRTTVYLLIVDTELSEWEENTKFGRVRKWFYADEAKSELEKHKPVQGSYLNLLKGFQACADSSPTSNSMLLRSGKRSTPSANAATTPLNNSMHDVNSGSGSERCQPPHYVNSSKNKENSSDGFRDK